MWNYSELFLRDLDALFRIALLITGSVELAERALIESMDVLSAIAPSGRISNCSVMVLTVARSSIAVLRRSKRMSDSMEESTLTLLHQDLRPILKLSPDLRCCFVLRTLLRYSHEQVGLLMNIQSEDAEMLAQTAVLQFAKLARGCEPEVPSYGRQPSFLQDASTSESAI